MAIVHGDVDFGLSIVARVLWRQTPKIEAHVENDNANADGLLECLLLAMSDLHLSSMMAKSCIDTLLPRPVIACISSML